MSGPSTSYVTFNVATYFFGVSAQDVQEVLCEQRVTHVPLAPPALAGLINLRGQIVPAINMHPLFGLDSAVEDLKLPGVVVRSAFGPVSLLVDAIGDVLELDSSSYEPPPVNMDSSLSTFVRGVHKLPGQLLLILDAGQSSGLQALVGTARV